MIRDVHTHNLQSSDGIISIEPSQYGLISKDRLYSMGIHPWNADKVTDCDWDILRKALGLPNVVMVGECGLDGLSIVSEAVQRGVFERQIDLSEEFRKPLVIHAVRRYPEIIRLKKKYHPNQPWIIHGFRGKPQIAKELSRHGFYISVGEKFNPESVSVIPPDRLLVETDESKLDISEIERNVGKFNCLSRFPAS